MAEADPDVIPVGPRGFDIATTGREMGVLRENPLWRELRAVRDGAVWVADGNAFFNRPGPRIVESTEVLSEIVQPDVCDYGHLGTADHAYAV